MLHVMHYAIITASGNTTILIFALERNLFM